MEQTEGDPFIPDIVNPEEALNDRVVMQPACGSYEPLGQQVHEGDAAPQDDSRKPHPARKIHYACTLRYLCPISSKTA